MGLRELKDKVQIVKRTEEHDYLRIPSIQGNDNITLVVDKANDNQCFGVIQFFPEGIGQYYYCMVWSFEKGSDCTTFTTFLKDSYPLPFFNKTDAYYFVTHYFAKERKSNATR